MTKDVRMGVVGAGSIAIRGILPHLAMYDLADRLKLQAVCDPVEGRAEAAAERFGIARSFATLEQLLDEGDVDAVSIASPIGLHYEQGRKALEAGKHVHFNKTMTTTVDEATDLIELAKRKDLRMVASPGEMLRPHNRFIREQIQQGALGAVTWAICGAAFGQYHEQERVRQGDDVLSNVDPSWYFRKPGGGPLYDMTVYALHGLTGILGPARRVTAMSGTRIKEREFRGKMVPTDADDNTLITIDFGDNLYAMAYGTAAGRVTASFAANYYGTKGSIVDLTMNGEPLQYPGWEAARAASSVAMGNQRLLPHVVGPHAEDGTQEHHVYEDVMQLVDWVREGKPSIVTAEHARHVIDIIEAGYRASETGQTQELRTTFTPV
jgi:predicted dehydrogenase